MTGLSLLLATAVACIVGGQSLPDCAMPVVDTKAVTQPSAQPFFSGDAIDVIVSAESYVVWDVETNTILKEHNATQERPVASLSKLLTVLAVRELLQPNAVVEIPTDVLRAQRLGANIKLIPGEHAKVSDLLAASLIPSANDAAVTLAVAAKGSEEEFARYEDAYTKQLGIMHTHVVNATGLQGGDQYSTAYDVKELFMKVYNDPVLRPFLGLQKGSLTSQEGTVRSYLSTNKLLGTYLPVVAAKTGYTTEAKENLALLTTGKDGQKIGIVLLGSEDRFQNMKILVEWIWRNYSWPTQAGKPVSR